MCFKILRIVVLAMEWIVHLSPTKKKILKIGDCRGIWVVDMLRMI